MPPVPNIVLAVLMVLLAAYAAADEAWVVAAIWMGFSFWLTAPRKKHQKTP